MNLCGLRGLYIHFPFCKKKCGYCDFISYEGHLDLIFEYVRYLKREIAFYPKFNIDSIYLGGGNPGFVFSNCNRAIIDLLRFIFSYFSVSGDCEITIEINPEDIPNIDFNLIKSIGINRISIGLQRANRYSLDILTRNKESFEIFKANYKRLCDFNISIDFIYGIPGDTKNKVRAEVTKILLNHPPDHVSIYLLEIKRNTEFYMDGYMNIIPDDEILSDIYYEIRDLLENFRYFQYEISNFSKKGKVSRHNMKYFKNEEHIGIGVGAWGCLNGIRYQNFIDFNGYFKALDNGNLPYYFKEGINSEIYVKETIMMSLRTVRGIKRDFLDNIKDILPIHIYNKIIKKILFYKKNGFIKEENGYLSIDRDYFFVSNEIIGDIIF